MKALPKFWMTSPEIQQIFNEGPMYGKNDCENDYDTNPCEICGGDMYYHDIATPTGFRAFHRCKACGSGYEF